MIVAIDGPAGAGKSTVARRVADALGVQLIDTGALYRAVAFHALESGVAPEEAEAVAAIARRLSFDFRRIDGENVLYVNGSAMGEEIRTPEVSQVTSVISSHPEVRQALLGVQRHLGEAADSVLEGRDIGTVVFPEADVKIYLTATAEERARRRHDQMVDRGDAADLQAIVREMKERDERDKNRDIAPLRKAEDAVVVDSTDMDIDGVVEAILSVVQRRR